MEKPQLGHKTEDPVFPGENWFFYWKTSPALWESKIKSSSGSTLLFVPINWTFHASTAETVQFGGDRPETALKTLEDMAKKWGKELCFLVPLGPAPFLSNGGIPPFLSNVLSLNDEGMAQVVLNNDFRINKIYSYYDPKVFQGFRKMSWALGEYIQKSGMTSPFMGLRAGYTQKGEFRTFMDDRSIAFEQGFTRFISQKKQDLSEMTPEKELSSKLEYIQLMDELYEQSARECLVRNWEGTLKVGFLGGGPVDIFCRTNELWEHSEIYFPALAEIQVNGAVPSAMLLNEQIKEGPLDVAISGLVTSGQLKEFVDVQLFEDDYNLSFKKLSFFEVYRGQNERVTHRNPWRENGLIRFFNREFSWTYTYRDDLAVEIDDEFEESIIFVSGAEISLTQLQKILKIFLSSGQICFDLNGVNSDVKRRLDQFLIENSIVTEKLNYYSPIVRATLGEGSLTCIDSSALAEVSSGKKESFWRKLIGLFEVRHLKVESDGVPYYWSARSPSQNELKYEQIRRLSLFNPSSYKKTIRVQSHKNFAFLKNADHFRGKLQNFPVGVEVELLPGGYSFLDYGYYE
jgi:hypothetical protein